MEKIKPDMKLQSEINHHRFFHLRQNVIRKIKSKDIDQSNEQAKANQISSDLPKLKHLVEQTKDDLQQKWQFVPFDRPGDYLQSMPNPNSDTEFIVVQPYCQKQMNKGVYDEVWGEIVEGSDDSDDEEEEKMLESPRVSLRQINTQLSRNYSEVSNYKKSNKKGSSVRAIGALEESLPDTFGIISFWKYNGEELRTFDCFHSFATPQILPLKDGSQKMYNMTCLMKGRNNEVFFFCHESDEKMLLCIIKDKAGQNEKKKGRFLANNVAKYEVGRSTELFNFMHNGMYTGQTQQFHTNEPTLIDVGSQMEPERLCVFSLFQMNKKLPQMMQECGPSIYFHSLRHRQTIKKILGGEAFIDLVVPTQNSHQFQRTDISNDKKLKSDQLLDVYYLTNDHFKKRWKPIKNEATLNNVLKNCNEKPVIVKMPMSFENCERDNVCESFPIKGQNNLSYDEGTEEYTSDKLALEFTNSNQWIKVIKPISKDEDGNLEQFAVVAVEHFTRDRVVKIFDLSKPKKDYFVQQIKIEGATGAFVSAYKGKGVIQIVIGDDSKFKLQFFSQKASTSPNKHNKRNKIDFDLAFENDSIGPYQLIAEKEMSDQQIGRFVPMEMTIVDREFDYHFQSNDDAEADQSLEVRGCFLNKNTFSLHMFQDQLSLYYSKVGKNFQCFKTDLKHVVEYPLLCFSGTFPDNDLITLVNLADMQSARRVLKLNNLKFICFVGHQCMASIKTKVCFLALRENEQTDYDSDFYEEPDRSADVGLQSQITDEEDNQDSNQQQIVHVILTCDKLFQKKMDRDLNYISTQIEYLDAKENALKFRRNLAHIIKVESIHDLKESGQSVSQCFVFQTEKNIMIFTQYDDGMSHMEKVTEKNMMQKLQMVRGHNNRFYFTESDTLNTQHQIMELRVFLKPESKKWDWNKRVIFQPSSDVIALEIDPDNIQAKYEKAGEMTNKIFFIDGQFQLMLLKEEGDDTEKYTLLVKKDLAEFKTISAAMQHLKQSPWNVISITERCITIQGKTLNFKSGHEWDFSFERVEQSERHKKWFVQSAKSVDNAHRQILVVERISKALPQKQKTKLLQAIADAMIRKFKNRLNKFTNRESAFIVKLHPGSRKLSLMGEDRISFVELIDFITDDHLLIKRRGNHWSIVNTRGQISELPKGLSKLLRCDEFTQMRIQRLHEIGNILLILESAQHVLAVQFNHRGAVVCYDLYNLLDGTIKEANQTIENKLRHSEVHNTQRKTQTVYKKEAKIQPSSVQADNKGRLYRFYRKFKTGQERQVMNSNPKKQQVILRKIHPRGTKTIDYDDAKNFIIELAFKEEQNQQLELNPQPFLICGDYLCWQRFIHNSDSKIKIYVARLDRGILLNSLNKVQDGSKDVSIHIVHAIDFNDYLQTKRACDVNMSVAPISTHLSRIIQKKSVFNGELNHNLLQVTVLSRAIIYDLNNGASAIKDISDLQQLADQEKFIPSEFNVQQCFIEKAQNKLQKYSICKQFVTNKSKSFFFVAQKSREINIYTDYSRTSELCLQQDRSEESKLKFFGAFMTYSEADLMEMERIDQSIKSRKNFATLDLQVILSTFLGYSVFSVQQRIRLLKMIEEKLSQSQDSELQLENDHFDKEIEGHLLRRLYQVLMLPAPCIQIKKVKESYIYGMFSSLQMLAYSGDTGASSKLLSIANRCEQTSLSCFVDTKEDTQQLFKNNIVQAIRLIENSFLETRATQQIESLKWPTEEQMIVFPQNSCLISQEECEAGILKALKRKKSMIMNMIYFYTCRDCAYCRRRRRSQDQVAENREIQNEDDNYRADTVLNTEESQQPQEIEDQDEKKKKESERTAVAGELKEFQSNSVNVRILDIGWIYSNSGTFLDLVKILDGANKVELFETKFMSALLEVFWVYNKQKIIKRIFLPYILYLTLTVAYMLNIVCDSQERNHGQGWKYGMEILHGFINLSITGYMIYIEVVQMKRDWSGYFRQVLNYFDLFQFTANVFITLVTIFEIDYFSIYFMRTLCSLVAIVIWIKVFDWFRIFDATSFYIKLLMMTIQDILPFFFIFPVFLMTFGTALLILSDNRGEDNMLIDEYTNSQIANAFINQYLLSLGEYDLDNLKGHRQSWMCYLLFFFATFLTQVTALNMIIAIMSDTFSKLSETRSQHKRQTQIALLSEHIDHIKDKQDEAEKPSRFLVVVTSTAETLQHGEWEGSLNTMRSYMQEASDKQREELDEKTKMLKDLILEQKARNNLQEKETQSKINEMNSFLKILSEKVSVMDSTTKTQVSSIDKKLDAVMSRLISQQSPQKR